MVFVKQLQNKKYINPTFEFTQKTEGRSYFAMIFSFLKELFFKRFQKFYLIFLNL